MTTYKEDDDQFLKQCTERQMHGYEHRDPEELWKEFETRHFKRRRRSSGVRLTVVLGLVVLIALGTSVLAFPEQVRAVGKRLFSFTLEITGDTQAQIGVSVDTNGQEKGLTGKPAPSLLAEIKGEVPYAVKVPTYMPEGFQLVGYEYEPSLFWALTLQYQGDGRFIRFRQISFEASEDYASSMVIDTDDSIVSEVQIGGVRGTLVERGKDGWVLLQWIEGAIVYQLSGHVPPEEAVRIAESVTFIE